MKLRVATLLGALDGLLSLKLGSKNKRVDVKIDIIDHRGDQLSMPGSSCGFVLNDSMASIGAWAREANLGSMHLNYYALSMKSETKEYVFDGSDTESFYNVFGDVGGCKITFKVMNNAAYTQNLMREKETTDALKEHIALLKTAREKYPTNFLGYRMPWDHNKVTNLTEELKQCEEMIRLFGTTENLKIDEFFKHKKANFKSFAFWGVPCRVNNGTCPDAEGTRYAIIKAMWKAEGIDLDDIDLDKASDETGDELLKEFFKWLRKPRNVRTLFVIMAGAFADQKENEETRKRSGNGKDLPQVSEDILRALTFREILMKMVLMFEEDSLANSHNEIIKIKEPSTDALRNQIDRIMQKTKDTPIDKYVALFFGEFAKKPEDAEKMVKLMDSVAQNSKGKLTVEDINRCYLEDGSELDVVLVEKVTSVKSAGCASKDFDSGKGGKIVGIQGSDLVSWEKADNIWIEFSDESTRPPKEGEDQTIMMRGNCFCIKSTCPFRLVPKDFLKTLSELFSGRLKDFLLEVLPQELSEVIEVLFANLPEEFVEALEDWFTSLPDEVVDILREIAMLLKDRNSKGDDPSSSVAEEDAAVKKLFEKLFEKLSPEAGKMFEELDAAADLAPFNASELEAVLKTVCQDGKLAPDVVKQMTGFFAPLAKLEGLSGNGEDLNAIIATFGKVLSAASGASNLDQLNGDVEALLEEMTKSGPFLPGGGGFDQILERTQEQMKQLEDMLPATTDEEPMTSKGFINALMGSFDEKQREKMEAAMADLDPENPDSFGKMFKAFGEEMEAAMADPEKPDSFGKRLQALMSLMIMTM